MSSQQRRAEFVGTGQRQHPPRHRNAGPARLPGSVADRRWPRRRRAACARAARIMAPLGEGLATRRATGQGQPAIRAHSDRGNRSPPTPPRWSTSREASIIALAAAGGKAAREMRPEFLDQHRNSFGAPTTVPKRVLRRPVRRPAAVGEEDLHGVGDRALGRVQIVGRKPRFLADLDLRPQSVDARVGRCRVLVVFGVRRPLISATATMYCRQWSRSAGLCSGPCLSMMRSADSCVRIRPGRSSVEPSGDLRMQLDRTLDRRLGMELGGKLILKSTFSIT
jgi:hypothetical protein